MIELQKDVREEWPGEETSNLLSPSEELCPFGRLRHLLTVGHIYKAFRWDEEVSGRIVKNQAKRNGTRNKGWKTVWVKILKILLIISYCFREGKLPLTYGML